MTPVARVLYAARWIVIGGVLLESELRFYGARVDQSRIVVSTLAIAALTVLVQLAARRYAGWRNPLLLIAADTVMVSLVVYFSDGIQSPFYPLFYITLITAAATFGMVGGLISSVVIALASFIVEVADSTQALTEPRVIEDFVRTVPYLFLIGVITGALRDRIRVLADTSAALRFERAAIEREMETARAIQQAQLPSEMPSVRGLEIAIYYKPAREVGGDFYDFYPVAEDHLGVTIADVSGKGLPAALLVAGGKYAAREHWSHDQFEMMRQVNHHISQTTPDETFITMLYGIVSVKAREFRFVNAGHMPPIVVKHETREVVTCGSSDLPVGVLADAAYTQQSIPLAAGDILVLYTDGVTDALAPGDGVEAFQSFLQSVRGENLQDWGERLAQATGEPCHLDDSTLIAIRVS